MALSMGTLEYRQFMQYDRLVFFVETDDEYNFEDGSSTSTYIPENATDDTDPNQTCTDSINDSSSGFASDAASHTYSKTSMSTFKGSCSDSSESGRVSCREPLLSGTKTPAHREPNHYNPRDLNMQYRMSTPSPMSHKSSSSVKTTSSNRSSSKSSHISSHKLPTAPPVISYKNPAYEYQLDKHIEEIQYNIKRIELQDGQQYISSKPKSRHHKPSLFDLVTDDVIVNIFSNLPTDQLCRCSRVCNRWYRLSWDPLLWKRIVINSEKINVDKALKYLTKRLSYNTPTVCVIVERIILTGCEKLTNKGLHTIAKRCPELRHLEIQGCANITNDSLFEIASYCVNLEYLDTTGCPCVTSVSLTTQVLEQATAHHLRQIYLRFLDMTDCYALEDEGLQTLTLHCTQLQHLYLRRCVRIGDAGVQAIGINCPYIKELSISDCRKVTDYGVCALSKIGDNLRYLSVAKCDKVSDVGVIQLAKNCRKLRYLNVRGCEAVSDDAMDVLARNCTKLKSLDIGKCDVTDEGLQVLSHNCSQLKKLSLKSCDAITDDGVKCIAKKCRHLEQLNIQDCHLTVDAYRAVKRYCKKCFIEHTNPGFY